MMGAEVAVGGEHRAFYCNSSLHLAATTLPASYFCFPFLRGYIFRDLQRRKENWWNLDVYIV